LIKKPPKTEIFSILKFLAVLGGWWGGFSFAIRLLPTGGKRGYCHIIVKISLFFKKICPWGPNELISWQKGLYQLKKLRFKRNGI
jgi:hypothetical protein